MTKTYFDKMTESPEAKRIYQQERAILAATELIWQTMQEQGISKAQLAKRLGKSRAYVTQLLDGRANMTLRTVVDVFFALGKSVDVCCRPVSQASRKGDRGARVHASVKSIRLSAGLESKRFSRIAARRARSA